MLSTSHLIGYLSATLADRDGSASNRAAEPATVARPRNYVCALSTRSLQGDSAIKQSCNAKRPAASQLGPASPPDGHLPTAFGLRCLPDAVVTGRKPASIHRLAIAAGKIKMPSQLRNCSRHLGERSLSKIQYPHIALLAGAISRRKEGLALTKINKGGTSKTGSPCQRPKRARARHAQWRRGFFRNGRRKPSIALRGLVPATQYHLASLYLVKPESFGEFAWPKSQNRGL
jgi:hypothetical protein